MNLQLAHEDMIIFVLILIHEKEDTFIDFLRAVIYSVAIKPFFSELELLMYGF